jgi:hypothetical protein
MLKTDPEQLKLEFEALKLFRMQKLIAERENFCTQKEAARAFGVSIRKIQHFEKYDCTDPYLIWCYKRYFNSQKTLIK